MADLFSEMESQQESEPSTEQQPLAGKDQAESAPSPDEPAPEEAPAADAPAKKQKWTFDRIREEYQSADGLKQENVPAINRFLAGESRRLTRGFMAAKAREEQANRDREVYQTEVQRYQQIAGNIAADRKSLREGSLDERLAAVQRLFGEDPRQLIESLALHIAGTPPSNRGDEELRRELQELKKELSDRSEKEQRERQTSTELDRQTAAAADYYDEFLTSFDSDAVVAYPNIFNKLGDDPDSSRIREAAEELAELHRKMAQGSKKFVTYADFLDTTERRLRVAAAKQKQTSPGAVANPAGRSPKLVRAKAHQKVPDTTAESGKKSLTETDYDNLFLQTLRGD